MKCSTSHLVSSKGKLYTVHTMLLSSESANSREVWILLHSQACRKGGSGTSDSKTDLPHFQGPWAA